MILEEPEELSQYIDIGSPLAWRLLWMKIQVYVPITVFSIVCGSEMVVLTAWNHKDTVGKHPGFLLMINGMALLPLCFLAITSLRLRKGTRAETEINAEGIRTSSVKKGVLPWERVTSLRLTEMVGAKDLAVFRVGYVPGSPTSFWQKPSVIRVSKRRRKNGRSEPSLRIPLAYPRQTRLLNDELDALRQTGESVPLLASDINQKRQIRGIGGIWAAMLGMYLMLHGLPLLMVGIEQSYAKFANQSASESGKNSKIGAKLGPILAGHFHSIQAMNRFFIGTGGILSVAGGLFYFTGLAIGRTKKELCSNVSEIEPG